MLDMLCLAGEVGWARLSAPEAVLDAARRSRRSRSSCASTPTRGSALRPATTPRRRGARATTRGRCSNACATRGASFFNDLAAGVRLDADRLRQAIGVLVAAGLAVVGRVLRAARADRRRDGTAARRRIGAPISPAAGRVAARGRRHATTREAAVEQQARTLLSRYGVVFRRLLTREPNAAPWRELTRIYRRLEARGEIRGGRFVSGMAGEQFALPDAVQILREVRRTPATGRLATIGTADPLNLAGIVTAGDRVRASGRNRMAYRDGVPLAVLEGEELRTLTPLDASERAAIARVLIRKRTPARV